MLRAALTIVAGLDMNTLASAPEYCDRQKTGKKGRELCRGVNGELREL